MSTHLWLKSVYIAKATFSFSLKVMTRQELKRTDSHLCRRISGQVVLNDPCQRVLSTYDGVLGPWEFILWLEFGYQFVVDGDPSKPMVVVGWLHANLAGICCNSGSLEFEDGCGSIGHGPWRIVNVRETLDESSADAFLCQQECRDQADGPGTHDEYLAIYCGRHYCSVLILSERHYRVLLRDRSLTIFYLEVNDVEVVSSTEVPHGGFLITFSCSHLPHLPTMLSFCCRRWGLTAVVKAKVQAVVVSKLFAIISGAENKVPRHVVLMV